MPPNTRASAISLRALSNPTNQRTEPGLISEVALNGTSGPKIALSTLAAAPARLECPEGYSGCAEVVRNGVHVGSATVSSFPSSPAKRIAVTGRQNTYRYLASQVAMDASAMATCRTAKRCALSEEDNCRAWARSPATRVQ